MSDSSRQIVPFEPDSTNETTLEWITRQFFRLSNILSDLTDGTGSKLKWIKIVGSTDGTTYTVSINEHVILVDADSADVTLNLPAGIDRKRYHIKNISPAGSYNVIVTPDGSETIDNGATASVATNQAISPIYIAMDTNWYIL